ncbi:SGNH/GDSL hydrolase family protein [Methylocella sp.]|uniref:SGNH/GDSL hydrolase family protein n=1 Tax=Methylocella sp. TaxID=1978226 RepID=UPI0035AF5F5F
MTRRLNVTFQCLATLALVAFIVWLEIKRPFPSFRTATLLSAAALFCLLAFACAGRLRDVCVTLCALTLGLGVAEGAARALEPAGGLNITRGWSVRQPILGWGPERPGSYHAEMRGPAGEEIYTADYTIDENLLRRTVSQPTGPAIVFFGDSYTFGDGIGDDQTLPQRFADLLGRKQRVVNLAFTGYGPQQFLRAMETSRDDALIGPDPRLFIFLTAPWHAERTGCKAYWTARSPHYAIGADGSLAFAGECFEGAKLHIYEWLQDSALFRRLVDPYRRRVSHDDVELYVRVLEAAIAEARSKYGVPTLIPYLRVPREYLAETGFTDEAIMDRLRAAGAIVVDASLREDEAAGKLISIKGDGHPTPYANVRRAEMIKAAIEQNLSGGFVSELN